LNAASRFSMPWRRAIRAKSLLLERVWPDSRGRNPKQARCSHAQLSSAAGENSLRWPSVRIPSAPPRSPDKQRWFPELKKPPPPTRFGNLTPADVYFRRARNIRSGIPGHSREQRGMVETARQIRAAAPAAAEAAGAPAGGNGGGAAASPAIVQVRRATACARAGRGRTHCGASTRPTFASPVDQGGAWLEPRALYAAAFRVLALADMPAKADRAEQEGEEPGLAGLTAAHV
jgi:hypothetical protein